MEWLIVPVVLYLMFRKPTDEEVRAAADAEARSEADKQQKAADKEAKRVLVEEQRRRATFVQDQEKQFRAACAEIARLQGLTDMERAAAQEFARMRFLRALEEHYQQ